MSLTRADDHIGDVAVDPQDPSDRSDYDISPIGALALAEHFIETWRPLLKLANTLQRRVRARDNHFCQVPGCSRAAVHTHHIIPVSQGGSDDPENLISLCAAHHLCGIHGGRMRVTGTAPDNLVWEFELRRSYVAAA